MLAATVSLRTTCRLTPACTTAPTDRTPTNALHQGIAVTTPGEVIALVGIANLATFADVQAATTTDGANTIVDLGDGNTIVLVNVAIGTLTADDFVFV